MFFWKVLIKWENRQVGVTLTPSMWVGFWNYLCLVALMVKNLPAMQETQVHSLGPEDPLEKEMATYSSILAQGIPWTEEPDRLQFIGLQRVGHDWATDRLCSSEAYDPLIAKNLSSPSNLTIFFLSSKNTLQSYICHWIPFTCRIINTIAQ